MVKPGDTLTAIAAKFGTTVAAIVAANNITNPNLISVGQVLVIPS
jgi:LysM repeat protein